MFRPVIEDIRNDLRDPEFAEEYGAEMAKLSFSNTLFDARNKAKKTQKELADTMGLSQPYIARLESGEANPTLSVIGRILATIGLRLITDTTSLMPENDTLSQKTTNTLKTQDFNVDPSSALWEDIFDILDRDSKRMNLSIQNTATLGFAIIGGIQNETVA